MTAFLVLSSSSDLKPVCEQNKLVKYADDTYIVMLPVALIRGLTV